MNKLDEWGGANALRTCLIFIRHGQAAGVEGRCIGHTDVPLSPQGIASLHALLLNQEITRIVSSDLKRAAESARIIAAGLQLPIEFAARLRELNFGEWDGRTWAELEEFDGERLKLWMDNWTQEAPPAGESMGQFVGRVANWLHDTVQAASAVEHTTLVVAHAGSIRVALSLLRDAPMANMFEIPVPHATPIVVQINRWSLRDVGEF